MGIHVGTGILATFCGPPTWTPESIHRTLEIGVRSFRVTTSYRGDEENRELVGMLRAAGPVTVHLDVGRGTKLRVARFSAPRLETGATVTLGSEPGCDLHLERPLGVELPVDTVLYLGDSDAVLRVGSRKGEEYSCSVTAGGRATPGKAITAAGIDLGLGTVNAMNEADFATAGELGVEYAMVSFVRSAADIDRCRALLPPEVGISVKIETREAVEDLDAIVAASDVVVIGRGDLALQCGPEHLGLLQWRIAEASAAAGKPFVVATQVFESVLGRAVPNRAELHDLAAAAALGADEVMFGPETCKNPHQVEAMAAAQHVLDTVSASGVRLRVDR
nr:pyruvate kinase [Actinophytocola oryzae]